MIRYIHFVFIFVVEGLIWGLVSNITLVVEKGGEDAKKKVKEKTSRDKKRDFDEDMKEKME